MAPLPISWTVREGDAAKIVLSIVGYNLRLVLAWLRLLLRLTLNANASTRRPDRCQMRLLTDYLVAISKHAASATMPEGRSTLLSGIPIWLDRQGRYDRQSRRRQERRICTSARLNQFAAFLVSGPFGSDRSDGRAYECL
jgi:hypothetical protein